MRPVKNIWPKTTSSTNVKFFAQLMREMLSAGAFESFRAYSLDTVARLDESLIVIDDISRQRIPPAAVDPILEELAWSLKRDPVADQICHEAISSFSEAIKPTKRDLRLIKSNIVFLHKKLNDKYHKFLEDRIIFYHDKVDKKAEFRTTIAAYCTHLINIGYSKNFLLHNIENKFFTHEITRAGQPSLTSLFKDFDGVDKKFRVITPMHKDFGEYVSRLTGAAIPNIDFFSGEARIDLEMDSSFNDENVYFVKMVTAKDQFSAAKNLENYLTSLRAITFLARRGIKFQWSHRKYVSRMRATSGIFVPNGELQFQVNVAPTGRAIKSMQSQSNQILSLFNADSTERLLSSINTSALARYSPNPENQLISLWSAVEVLLSDTPFGIPRIVHYVDLLVPCVCLKYVRRYIIAIYEELLVGYRSRFNKLMRQLPNDSGIDPYTQFTHLIFNEQHADLRKKLFQLCNDNPLAMHRIWKLHKDFSNPAALLDSLDSHQNRVKWQVHRIYRARNQLVHAGKVPNYLESLVLNVFEYYRSAIGSILNISSKEGGLSDIDQVVSEIGIEYFIYRRTIKETPNGLFEPKNFHMIFR